MTTKTKKEVNKVALKITDEDFIRHWQNASGGVKEIATTFGVDIARINSRAMAMRKHGVRLKSMRTSPRKDWSKLVALAETFYGSEAN